MELWNYGILLSFSFVPRVVSDDDGVSFVVCGGVFTGCYRGLNAICGGSTWFIGCGLCMFTVHCPLDL